MRLVVETHGTVVQCAQEMWGPLEAVSRTFVISQLEIYLRIGHECNQKHEYGPMFSSCRRIFVPVHIRGHFQLRAYFVNFLNISCLRLGSS